MNLGHHPSNSFNSIPPYHTSTSIPLHSHVASSPSLNHTPLQIPSFPSSTSRIGIPLHETQDQVNNNNNNTRVTNLIKPLSFFTPFATPTPTPLMTHSNIRLIFQIILVIDHQSQQLIRFFQFIIETDQHSEKRVINC